MNGKAACFENANLSGALLLLFHFNHQHFLRATFVAGANLEEMNGKTATFDSANLTGCISSCLLKGTLAD
jgi:uncharacterized protein YjbI with pentapeptide repeats